MDVQPIPPPTYLTEAQLDARISQIEAAMEADQNDPQKLLFDKLALEVDELSKDSLENPQNKTANDYKIDSLNREMQLLLEAEGNPASWTAAVG